MQQLYISMENFAAIDFETANAHRASVCSVGVVVVRDGEIVEQGNHQELMQRGGVYGRTRIPQISYSGRSKRSSRMFRIRLYERRRDPRFHRGEICG